MSPLGGVYWLLPVITDCPHPPLLQANKLFAAPADVFKFITDAIPI